jgi:exosortase
VFALPIPLAATERIHLVLRYIATDATAAIVPLLGIPVYAEATTLHLPRSQLTVADACSGFSTLYASAAMACLVAYQTDGWARRVLVLAAAAPLAVAANILRVVILAAVVARTGVDVLQTWIHPATGVMTFALALPVIFWLGSSREQPAVRPSASPVGEGPQVASHTTVHTP